MAFIKTTTSRKLTNGVITEEGTYALSGGDTTATIVPDAFGGGFNAQIKEIADAGVYPNTLVTAPVINMGTNGGTVSPRSRVFLSTVANDTGNYTLRGRCA